jgi:hypothetical protein
MKTILSILALLTLVSCADIPSYKEKFNFNNHIILVQNNHCEGFLSTQKHVLVPFKDAYISAHYRGFVVNEDSKTFEYQNALDQRVVFLGIENDTDLNRADKLCANMSYKSVKDMLKTN